MCSILTSTCSILERKLVAQHRTKRAAALGYGTDSVDVLLGSSKKGQPILHRNIGRGKIVLSVLGAIYASCIM